MRGRSMTVSRARTHSVSFAARLALALNRDPVGPTLESLPTEILLKVVQVAAAVPHYSTNSATAHRLGSYADNDDDDADAEFIKQRPHLDYDTLRTLALTSRVLAGLAHAIMYGSVELNELKRMTLFARTVIDCAHRDITLSSTTSPISPAYPTSAAFSYVPTLFAGKFTTRLTLEYPFIDHPRAPKTRGAELERFYATTGALLGFGCSAPSVVSPVLVSLRTLIVDSRILEYHLKHTPVPNGSISVTPAPSELVLHSYIPWSPPSPSPLTPLSSRLTHLTIACPSARWTLPSATLAALGGVLQLTHLALVRKAHANEDNDAEFVRDVVDILSERAQSLVRLVLVVIPDSGFETWKYAREYERFDPLDSDSDEDNRDMHDLRMLEDYLTTTYIWQQFTALALTSHASPPARVPSVCIVPGMGDAWSRALRKGRKSGAVFESNIFHDQGRDLWNWAYAFEARWRA